MTSTYSFALAAALCFGLATMAVAGADDTACPNKVVKFGKTYCFRYPDMAKNKMAKAKLMNSFQMPTNNIRCGGVGGGMSNYNCCTFMAGAGDDGCTGCC